MRISWESYPKPISTAVWLMFSTSFDCFVWCCRFYGAEVDDSEDKRRVQRLVNWFTRRGYTAHSLVLFQMLNPDYWYGWPEDIFWQHRDVDPFL